MSGSDADPRIGRACRALLDVYDTQGWWPARTRFEVMAGAVLVQNTRWANVVPALRALRRARVLSPRRLAILEQARITELVRPAGCQSVKARRLRALARTVVRAGGLDSVARLPTDQLRQLLLATHGIGQETADAMLAFAFRRPVFVADGYARRWVTRMGLCPQPAGYETLRRLIEAAFPGCSELLRDLHAAIVLHGQQTCTSEPDCERCGLRTSCRTALIASPGSGP